MTEQSHGLQHVLGISGLELVSYGLVAVSVLLLVFYFVSGRRGGGGGLHVEAWLEDESGASKQKKVELDGKRSLVIGRVAAKYKDARNLVVPQSTVGRIHAVIDFHDGGFWLNDQNSTNGTFVNGRRLDRPHRLRDGDVVMFHEYPFRFSSRQNVPEGDKTVIASGSAMDEATKITSVTAEQAAARKKAAAAMAAKRPAGGKPQDGGPGGFQSPTATEEQYPVNKDYEAALDNLVDEQGKAAAPPPDYDKNAGTVHQAQALADDFKGESGQGTEDLTLDNFIDDQTLSKEKRGKKR